MGKFKRSPRDGRKMDSVSPAWAGWLFGLTGVGFLAVVYGQQFRPAAGPDGLQLFVEPNDIDLWVGMAIVVMAFSGAGMAILAQRANWTESRRWDKRLLATYTDEPWRWRAEWNSREIRPERYRGRRYFVLWGVLCLLAGVPGTERWASDGGWPDHLVEYTGIGALALGCVALAATTRAYIRSLLSPAGALHLASETGVVGGPLEGAIKIANAGEREFLVRLVCEKHWISERRTSDGTTVSQELSSEFEDTYRAFAENGLLPVRFGIPFLSPPTTEDWATPVHLWFVEVEDAAGKKFPRFWVPVFKTSDSREGFVLGTAQADRSIVEETPQQILARYGVTSHESNGEWTIDVPPGRSGGMGWGLLIFAVPCLGVSAFMLPRLWQWEFGLGAIIEIITGLVFGGVFGLIGFVMALIALQLTFERRRVKFDENGVAVRRSYLGIGWTSRLDWTQVKKIDVKHSGSATGQRQTYKSVIAALEPIEKPNGGSMRRRVSIVSSLPDEAAEAARALILRTAHGKLQPQT